MPRLNIKQRSDEWLKLKETKLGSSEVFGLVHYYITEEELQNAGINKDEFQDTPYSTAFELFHKFKNPDLYITKPFTKENKLFGERIEEFAFHYLNNKGKKYNTSIEQGGVYVEDGLIASLDIEATANSTDIIQDANGHYISLKDEPRHLIEIKGSSNYLVKSKNTEIKGVDWKFIFQTQFAMMLTGYSWCRVIVVSLLSDTQFERGLICGMPKQKAIKYIKDHAEIHNFIYKVRPEYQYLIKTAIKRFEYDLKANNSPKMPNTTNNKLIYRLVDQQASLLGTSDKILELDNFNHYFDIKNQKENIDKDLETARKRVTQLMLNCGKKKLISSIGYFSLNERSLTARKKTTKKGK